MVSIGVPGQAVVRPRGHVMRQGVVASLIFLAPVFLVLYLLTIPGGPWLSVLVTQVLATVLVASVGWAYQHVCIWVDAQGITERGFFGRTTRYPVDDIGSIVSAQTFDTSSATTVAQLFVCDHHGRQLVRMRGQFWTAESMATVIATLPVPHNPVTESLSTSELGNDFPGLLYWFERHPVYAATTFSTAVAALGIVVYLVLRLSGVAT